MKCLKTLKNKKKFLDFMIFRMNLTNDEVENSLDIKIVVSHLQTFELPPSKRNFMNITNALLSSIPFD